jgi:hypothetical protein
MPRSWALSRSLMHPIQVAKPFFHRHVEINASQFFPKRPDVISALDFADVLELLPGPRPETIVNGTAFHTQWKYVLTSGVQEIKADAKEQNLGRRLERISKFTKILFLEAAPG